MIHVASFSGGKDSTATILWLREHEISHRTIWCDTGWEHPLTYEYVDYLDNHLHLQLERLKSSKYPGGFEQLCIERKIVPGVKTRFCTEELKVFPMWEWIENQPDDVTMYQGIRAEESFARSRMGKRQWDDHAGGYWIERPIYEWTAEQVFEMHKRHGIEPNPLYLHGMSRVGCAPCIMVNKPDLRQWALQFPEVRAKVERLEAALKEVNVEHPESPRAFFRMGFIPQRYQKTLWIKTKDGREMTVPTAAESFDYVTALDANQLQLFDEPPAKCLSIYNLCE